METTVIEHGFNISPTTVYGFLVVILAIGNIIQFRQNKALVEKIISLNQDSVTATQAILAIVNTTNAAISDIRDRILEKLIEK